MQRVVELRLHHLDDLHTAGGRVCVEVQFEKESLKTSDIRVLNGSSRVEAWTRLPTDATKFKFLVSYQRHWIILKLLLSIPNCHVSGRSGSKLFYKKLSVRSQKVLNGLVDLTLMLQY